MIPSNFSYHKLHILVSNSKRYEIKMTLKISKSIIFTNLLPYLLQKLVFWDFQCHLPNIPFWVWHQNMDLVIWEIRWNHETEISWPLWHLNLPLKSAKFYSKMAKVPFPVIFFRDCFQFQDLDRWLKWLTMLILFGLEPKTKKPKKLYNKCLNL